MAQERLCQPESSEASLPASSLVGLSCLLADDAWEVRSLLGCLLQGGCSKEASELFYCIAASFLFGTRSLGLPPRFHFNVFQALYLFENEWGVVPLVSEAQPSSPPSKKRRGGAGTLMDFGFQRKVENEVRQGLCLTLDFNSLN